MTRPRLEMMDYKYYHIPFLYIQYSLHIYSCIYSSQPTNIQLFWSSKGKQQKKYQTFLPCMLSEHQEDWSRTHWTEPYWKTWSNICNELIYLIWLVKEIYAWLIYLVSLYIISFVPTFIPGIYFFYVVISNIYFKYIHID